MSAPSALEILRGRDTPPPSIHSLRAGDLTALLVDGDLRYVASGRSEYVRRIQVAVRDAAWDTIPGERTKEFVEEIGGGFRAGFESRHRAGDLAFSWRCEIDGRADGVISYSMDGVAESDFTYMRIGICVLHPIEGMAGRPFRAETPGGTVEGTLPRLVGVQEFNGEGFPPLFPPFNALTILLADGGQLRLEFEGDTFEMEDQRNWTDASFKTFSHSPPTSATAWPMERGRRLHHSVTVIPPPSRRAARPNRDTSRCAVRIGNPARSPLPRLGLGIAAGPPPSEREAELLRAAHLRHLRLDVRAAEPDAPQAVKHAASQCERLDCGLELAVYADEDDPTIGLAELVAASEDAPIERIIVLAERAETTPPGAVQEARRHLPDPAVPIGAGTNLNFAELNRRPPPSDGIDFVAYPVTPQVHADDDLSLVETPAAQGDTVAAATEACGLSVAVTPVTLRPRFNPDRPREARQAGLAPETVDPRQMSLLCAGWTIASVKHLARAGAATATYYETLGPRGVLEREQPLKGNPRADFASHPGMVYPVYHVLADLGEWRDGTILDCTSNDPLRVEMLAVQDDAGRLHALLANLTSETQRIVTKSLPGDRCHARILDGQAAPDSARRPEGFRAGGDSLPIREGSLELELSPYAVARLDAEVSPNP